MTSLRLRRLLPLVALTACARGGDAPASAAAGSPGGTLVISTAADADNFLPPITLSGPGIQVNDLIYQRLAQLGDGLNTVGDEGFIPDLASSWTWAPDSLSITFTLDPAARWHDGTPVRASDVAFSYALFMDPKTAAPAATQLSNVASVTATDSATVVAQFKTRRPEAFFDFVFQLYILPQHKLADADRSKLAASPLARAPIGSGPFRLVEWLAEQRVALAADTTGGRRRAQLDRVVFNVADAATAYTRVASGEADLFEAMRPDKVAEVIANPQLRLVTGPGLDYNYLGFNLRDAKGKAPHPIFSDRSVRRALTMATDRRAIVANIYDTLAVQARGPFTTATASNDPALVPLPYAVDSANALLDAAGWVRGSDSVRAKNGKRLTFGMLVPSSSTARMRAAVLLQEQFRKVGVDAQVDAVEFPTFLERAGKRQFDALVNQWSPDPGTGSVNDMWTTKGMVAGGNNFGYYSNPAFDAQVDSGMAAFQPAAMRAHFARAWKIIADDAPAIWLAEPKRVMAVHKRIQTTGIRPGAWWAGIAKWSIPADQRIARDQPAATAAR